MTWHKKKYYYLEEDAEREEIEHVLSSVHPYVAPEWRDIMLIAGASVGLWRGEKALMMDGRPVSTDQIRDKYNKIISATCRDRQEGSAV